MGTIQKYADEYQMAIDYGISKLPYGEECRGILLGAEEYSLLKKFLLRYAFGWMVNLLFRQPRMYSIIYSDFTVIFVGLKPARLTTGYEPEFFFIRSFSFMRLKKGMGEYLLYTTDEQNRKLRLTIDAQGQIRKDLDRLADFIAA